MIYSEPRFLPGGDRFILIEFGNEMNLELNFLAQGLASAIAVQQIPSIIETAPCFASLLIHYDPDLIAFADLEREMAALIRSLGPSDDLVLDSRLFYLPTMYLDPWTQECVADYCEKITPKERDPELLVRINDLAGPDQLVRVHSGSEYWVAALGFWPGLPFLMALDPRSRILAPKYNPPRTWTPQGTIGLGGASTSIYPVNTPGGYQIFARTPVPIWDAEKRFPPFRENIVLFRPGDRVKFIPIDKEEYESIAMQVEARTYVYNIVEYQKFSVRSYKTWIHSLAAAERF